ncbi:hypothetical protein GAI15033_08220 [Parvimonas parva]
MYVKGMRDKQLFEEKQRKQIAQQQLDVFGCENSKYINDKGKEIFK